VAKKAPTRAARCPRKRNGLPPRPFLTGKRRTVRSLQEARRNAESGDQSKEVTPAAKPGNVRSRWKGKNSLRNAGERQIWTTLPTATAMNLPSGLKRIAEDRAAAEVGVERAALVVGREEEFARGGGGEARDVGGGLEGERGGGGGGVVGGRDAVADRGEDGGVPAKTASPPRYGVPRRFWKR
jgi:hypothetical protein